MNMFQFQKVKTKYQMKQVGGSQKINLSNCATEVYSCLMMKKLNVINYIVKKKKLKKKKKNCGENVYCIYKKIYKKNLTKCIAEYGDNVWMPKLDLSSKRFRVGSQMWKKYFKDIWSKKYVNDFPVPIFTEDFQESENIEAKGNAFSYRKKNIY